MIVIGYPGIGKSTLASRDICYIDLESSNFRVNGKRADDWYIPYCQVAEDLSRQGYIVFTSSHDVVRKQLAKSEEPVVIIYPARELRDAWIERTWTRYQKTGLDKDYNAYVHTKLHYDDDISELESCDILTMVTLRDINYDLDAVIETIERCG